MMLISRHNPVSLLDNAPLAQMLERNLDFQRIQTHIDSGALYAVCRDRLGLHLGPERVVLPGGSGVEGGSATSASAPGSASSSIPARLGLAAVHFPAGN